MEKYTEELAPIIYGDDAIKTLHVVTEAGNPGFFLHWHNRMELILLRKGELRIGFNENTDVLYPNEIYIIPPKAPHYAVAQKTQCEWDVLMFDVRSYYNNTKLCDDFLKPLYEGRVKFKFKTNHRETVQCFNKILSLHPKNDFESLSQIYRIIDLLLKHSSLEISDDIKGRHIITDATKYIRNNLSQEIKTKNLAQKYNYSEEYFCRMFKKITNFSPMSYLKICRLEKAANLISSEKHTITEVAKLCGFSDPNYFTRCFKSHFKTTPTKFLEETTDL